ncbi:MAG TPA: hypothetical protein VFW83_06360 [Bryobacteraceae bacterium]|nr:hypothetical protein [Bryobacteraceae bacterium]
MRPLFLLPETTIHRDGAGSEIAIDNNGAPVALTLGITCIAERESLDVSIWGSSDGRQWRQVAAFPQKFYCGSYSATLDLGRFREVKYLRAQWKIACWGDARPLFGFYLFAEEVKLQRAGAA